MLEPVTLRDILIGTKFCLKQQLYGVINTLTRRNTLTKENLKYSKSNQYLLLFIMCVENNHPIFKE